jgi:hypothetical protein
MEKKFILINLICTNLDIKERKNAVIKLQKFQEAAILRDLEKQNLIKISEIMSEMLLYKESDHSNINISIENYLKENYGIEFYGGETSISLKRKLVIEELFKDL